MENNILFLHKGQSMGKNEEIGVVVENHYFLPLV